MAKRSILALAAALAVAAAHGAAPTGAAEPAAKAPATYDLLFRDGALDEIDKSGALIYRRDVTSALAPQAAERDSGEIALTFGEEAATLARLELRRDGAARPLGSFPASVGNPMIMFFYETVVRDMAEAAGGSPFYIRNRVKEALVRPGEVTKGEAEIDGRVAETVTVRMAPFADDPNRDRMRGFGDLTLVVTMSEAAPGWYLSFVADAGAATEGGPPVYRSEVTLTGFEAGE